MQSDNWSRVIMRKQCRLLLNQIDLGKMHTLEISGSFWRHLPVASYKSIKYQDFDVCDKPLQETFDLIIAEQVFEHLLWPYRACRNVFTMLNKNGFFLISTPFLVRIHNEPFDCSRWTEVGLKYFLAEGGFHLNNTKTGSWGNRECTIANLQCADTEWILYQPNIHSLKNESDVPYHVWALTQKI